MSTQRDSLSFSSEDEGSASTNNNMNNNNININMDNNNNNKTSTCSEKEKMIRGDFYQAFDPELLHERQRAKEICFRLNQTPPSEKEQRQALVAQLLMPRQAMPNIWIESPFHVDYGYMLQVGDNFYANHGCTILDCNIIRIGKNCLLAPHVCISAAAHPIDPILRASGAEFTAPITIGDNVWIGANATICPGVTLGNNVVVGAGAVVTKDFPDNVVIGGVPAKIIKELLLQPNDISNGDDEE